MNTETERQQLPVIITIHDVMPSTLAVIREIVAFMDDEEIPPAPLLVSPGTGWDAGALGELHGFADKGHELVAHGWRHRAESFGGLRHRLHGLLISRRAAEHLALPRERLIDLLQASYDWFPQHNFAPPRFYVPPAWAMGSLSGNDLTALPFRYYENLTGIIDSQTGRSTRLPLAGFEANNLVRERFLRWYNRRNEKKSRRTDRKSTRLNSSHYS